MENLAPGKYTTGHLSGFSGFFQILSFRAARVKALVHVLEKRDPIIRMKQ